MEQNTSNQYKTTRRQALGLLGALAVGAASPSALANESGVPVPVAPSFGGDAARKGLAIAQHAERYDSGWIDQYSKGRMTLFDARGDSVRRGITQMVLEGNDGDKSLVKFLTPADVQGVAALIHEHPRATDDSWLYLPASRRVRRISGANRSASFQGTEFTYEDLSSFAVARYSWRYVKDDTISGQPVYVLEATPKDPDSGYSKLVVNINQNNFRGEMADFYDLAGRHLKTLRASQWKQLHGRFWRATRMDMKNHQTGKRTMLELETLFVNLAMYPKADGSKRSNLTSERFTKHALAAG